MDHDFVSGDYVPAIGSIVRGAARRAAPLWLPAAILACGSPLGVAPPDVPLPPVLGVDSLVVGEMAFRCGRWIADEPPADHEGWAVLDLYFRRAAGGASAGDQTAVHAVGGQVIEPFESFPVLRVVIALDSIPRLWDLQVLDHARTVPYSDRKDVPFTSEFTGGLEDDWRLVIEEAGGSVDRVIPQLAIVSGVLPDSAAEAVRGHVLVRYVELNGQLCIA